MKFVGNKCVYCVSAAWECILSLYRCALPRRDIYRYDFSFFEEQNKVGYIWSYDIRVLTPRPRQRSRFRDVLRAWRSGDRTLVWGGGREFAHPSRPAPRSTYSGYQVSSAGIKRPGCGVEHPPSSSAEIKETVELYLYSPSAPLRPGIGRTVLFTFFYILHSVTILGFIT